MSSNNSIFTQVKTSKLTQWNAESLKESIADTANSFYIFFGKPLSRNTLYDRLTPEQVASYNLLRHILEEYQDYPDLFNENHFLLYKKVSEKIDSYDGLLVNDDEFYNLSVGVNLDGETWERNYHEIKYIGKENQIPLIDDALHIQYRIWKDIIGMKRVNSSDISLGFRKIIWTYEDVYDEWNDLDDMSDPNTRFYVMTSQRRVYKCISNNNGANSIDMPTHVTSAIKQYPDGYRWKYMFSITISQLRKFFHPDYLPVNYMQSVVDSSTSGTIDKIMIINGGVYTPNSINIPIYTGGNGDGFVSVNKVGSDNIVVDVLIPSGSITSLSYNEINVPPDSFISSLVDESIIPFLIRQDNDGIIENAYGLATKTNGTLELQVKIAGSGYTSGPVQLIFSPVRAFGTTNNEGILSKVEVSLEPGENGSEFTFAKSVAVPLDGFAIKYAVLHPVISPFGGHGSRPEKELLAKNVLVNVRIAYTEEDESGESLSVDNDFRQIGFIRNPKNRIGGDLYTQGIADMTTKMTISPPDSTNPIEFVPDDIIIGKTSLASAICIDSREEELNNADNKKRVIRFVQNYTSTNVIPFVEGEVVYPRESSDQKWEVDSITSPNVLPYSGDILFVSNIEPIPRDPDQIESITLAIEF